MQIILTEEEYLDLKAKQSDDGTIWYRIKLGIEPNGSAGWVRASDVTMERASDRIVVDMSNRKLRHFRNGKLRHHFRIAIGAPDTPTTPGHFFVWAHLLPTRTAPTVRTSLGCRGSRRC